MMKSKKRDYKDFMNSEGVVPVIFLKELLNEVFELKPQSKAKAKKETSNIKTVFFGIL